MLALYVFAQKYVIQGVAHARASSESPRSPQSDASTTVSKEISISMNRSARHWSASSPRRRSAALAACSSARGRRRRRRRRPSAPRTVTITLHELHLQRRQRGEPRHASSTPSRTANPGITVDVTTLAYADYFTALQTDLAAGTVADVFDIEYANFAAYAGQRRPRRARRSSTPSAYTPSLLETYQTDGTQYALPSSFSDVVLFYNKTSSTPRASTTRPPTGRGRTSRPPPRR